jgi:hypothetical protein
VLEAGSTTSMTKKRATAALLIDAPSYLVAHTHFRRFSHNSFDVSPETFLPTRFTGFCLRSN